MAPNFLKFREFRKASKGSVRSTDQSTDASSNDDGQSQNTTATTPGSGSITPPSIAAQSDPALHSRVASQPQRQSLPMRPPLQSVAKRHSVSGMTGLGSPELNRKSSLPVSQYAPRILNTSQKVLLVDGQIGDPEEPARRSVDGIVTVSWKDDAFPPVSYPVCEGYFKAVVCLKPGRNALRFDFSSPKLVNSHTSNPLHTNHIIVHNLPKTDCPPLQLAILLAKDSPGTFDAVPARIEKEGNGLETAVRKYRMAAYLWQAYTAEQMFNNHFSRRTFRFEEEWMTGTSFQRDREMGTMRSEARVHIIRSDKTVAELRDIQRAQQNENATNKNDLFDIAHDAVRKHFGLLPGQEQYVSVLMLDSHWDPALKLVTGHAALGGVRDGLHLAIFGSHALQSYPSTFEEVVPAFTDCTPTDTQHVANDANESGSSWEAANVGIGAHLHEVGHLFGCPHQEHGIMRRDYIIFSRSFLSREAYCTRTKSKGGPVVKKDECNWHRLDCLRFRSHPCFRLSNDPVYPNAGVQVWPVENQHVCITSPSGIGFIEIFTDDDDVCRTWKEYSAEPHSRQREVTLKEQDLRRELPASKAKSKLRVRVHALSGPSLDIDDFCALCSKDVALRLSYGLHAYRGKKVGASKLEGSESQEVLFTSSTRQERVMSRIVVYHGRAVDGIEFFYDDESSQLFGKRGGKPGGDTFELDIRRGEYLTGFIVRSGFYLDAIQITTSMARKSPIYGNVHGGDPHTLFPPRGYRLCGVTGTCGPWVDGFAAMIMH
ncbi:putative peptidase family-domain-containing protein [Xylariomycetidae sp. FL2044]|nr:putative peptidase family-domain-containing protein [Xylariomycetidae sp. FL2044]